MTGGFLCHLQTCGQFQVQHRIFSVNGAFNKEKALLGAYTEYCKNFRNIWLTSLVQVWDAISLEWLQGGLQRVLQICRTHGMVQKLSSIWDTKCSFLPNVKGLPTTPLSKRRPCPRNTSPLGGMRQRRAWTPGAPRAPLPSGARGAGPTEGTPMAVTTKVRHACKSCFKVERSTK